MYIWKTKILAADIKNNAISQNEWKKYYLALSIFITIAMYIVGLSPRENLLAVFVEATSVIAALVVGISVTYQSNKGDNGVDYIARMTALSLPILIKLSLLFFTIGIFVGIISASLSISESMFEWVMVCFSPIVQAVFFWRINIYLKYINA